MTTAELVNLILAKLRTGRVVFNAIHEEFGDYPLVVYFTWGCQNYSVQVVDGCIAVERNISERGALDCGSVEDNYAWWIEGVLNGKVRNDAGELAETP